MATIDTSIVNVAMPQIRGELGASLHEITLVTTGYMIAMVPVMPKRVYVASLALFTIGSVLGGTARSLERARRRARGEPRLRAGRDATLRLRGPHVT